jgi:hypothetical protein
MSAGATIAGARKPRVEVPDIRQTMRLEATPIRVAKADKIIFRGGLRRQHLLDTR